MRIVHVVTYVSPDGAYGGPVRVAFGQATELAARGHQVTVYAAAPDHAPRDVIRDGFRLRTFPARRVARRLGFAGMYARGLVRELRAELREADVAHVHLARDLVTLPAARAARKAGVPLVVQPHGMIDASTNPLAGPVDAWETRAALRAASAVLVLTDREERDVRAVAAGAHVHRIANGVSFGELPPWEGRAARVLFLARLHARKRPVAFVEMAALLAARGVSAEFVLAGADEGEADAVRAAIGESTGVSWIGAVDPSKTDELLASAQVYVLPAVDEVFPMSILEAFRAGTPVVTTDSLGIAEACARHGAAIITDGSPAGLADAVERILREPRVGAGLRAGARRMLEAELSIASVVDTLVGVYEAARTGDVGEGLR